MDPATAVEATRPFVDDDARDRLTVTGADAETYLQSQLSQSVTGLAVGDARWSFVLDPTGKIDALLRVEKSGDTEFRLDTDAGFGEALEARLRRFMIRVDVEIASESAGSLEPGGDHETARIGAGWPRLGAEIEPGSTIPASTGVVTLACDFTKGCYPGQELVERMASRDSEAPTRVRIVDLDEGAAAGDDVSDPEGNVVGTITSVASEGGVGIALIKRSSDFGTAPTHAG
ncbi:MAG: hypothetical protein AAF945_14005 [Actinomycetota bacterium]